MDPREQHGYVGRFAWGEDGARRLARACDAIVVVDVLTFCTDADAAVAAGGGFPLDGSPGAASARAAAEAGVPVLAACFRNASAVAAAVVRLAPVVGVVAAGERDGGALWPCVEDLLGAGAVLEALGTTVVSPEAAAAIAAWRDASGALEQALAACESGRALRDAAAVRHAAESGASTAVPRLSGDAFEGM